MARSSAAQRAEEDRKPRLRLVQENFDFYVKLRVHGFLCEVHVEVRAATVTLFSAAGRSAVGIWDAGRYVRYPDSQKLQVHPLLLDEIDAELRLRMTLKGIQARVDPPRASAVGYGNR